MAKKNNKGSQPSLSVLDKAIGKLISTIDSSYTERTNLANRDTEFQSILADELDIIKGVSDGGIIDFATSVMKDANKSDNNDDIDAHSMFTEDIGNIFGYFQDMYKNRYLELADLKFISKFIPDIGESVKTTLDAIVSSDDFSTSITRTLQLNPSLTEEEKAIILAEIGRVEEEHGLLKKLKNITYKNTIIAGTSYIYSIPYDDLFSEYDRLLKSGKLENGSILSDSVAKNRQSRTSKNTSSVGSFKATESVEYDPAGIAIEHVHNILDINKSNKAKNKLGDIISQENIDIMDKNISRTVEMYSTLESHIPPDVLEDIGMYDSFYGDGAMEASISNNNSTDLNSSTSDNLDPNLKNYSKKFGGVDNIIDMVSSAEGMYGNEKIRKAKAEKFDTTGRYVKYMNASSVVPIMIHNKPFGYLFVHDMGTTQKINQMNKAATSETTMMSSSYSVFNSVNLPDKKREAATRAIVDSITEGILANFSNKFIKKNAKFKNVIADCIVANGLSNVEYQIQFIPAKYVIPFTIDPDENGYGQSCIRDSLFPAKMLLQLIVSKLLLHLNKGGNKTISYIRKGPIDVNTANHTQRVIRMLQESNITFSDMLSPNLTFSKFNRYGNIQVPMSASGERLVDFETQEGQDVDMNTNMEEFLRKLAMLGTPTPSVLIEYTDTADYAKSLVTASLKFAQRVASFQSDLEEPTTILYKGLIESSKLTEELKQKALIGFKFSLARPKVLSNANMGEYLSQMQTITESIGNLFLGTNDDGDIPAIRNEFVKSMATKLLPFVQWNDFEEMLKQAKISVSQNKTYVSADSNNDNTVNMGDSGGEY